MLIFMLIAKNNVDQRLEKTYNDKLIKENQINELHIRDNKG